MAKRSHDATAAVSLFPFLSILGCVMGVLTFVIACVVVGEVEPAVTDPEEAGRRLEDLAALTEQSNRDESEMDELRRLITEATQWESRLRPVREEAERLQKQIGQPLDDVRTMRDHLPRLADLRAKNAKLKELLDALKKLNEELGSKVATATENERRTIVLKPTGSGVGIKPNFIECRADELVLHPAQLRVPMTEIVQSPTLKNLVTAVKGRPDESIVLLIRSDGIRSFDAAQAVIRSMGAKYGYLPLPGDGPIDFKLFERK